MKIKWGALVTDGRNKIGGHVASKNRGGAYLRTKVTPSNPQTSYQMAVRSLFAFFSQSWRNLTFAQIESWNNAVANFSTTDIFGDIRNPTGKNLYQKLNTNLINAQSTAITTPPLPEGVPEVGEPTPTVTNTGQIVSVAYTESPVPADTVYIVEATQPMTVSQGFTKNQFRTLAVLTAGDTTPYVATSDYAARFGGFVLNQYIHIRMKAINTNTGEVSSPKISRADAGRAV